jgi:hypothetical protein
MPACEEKNWPRQSALDGAAACADDPMAATAATIPAIMTLIFVRLTIERPPVTQFLPLYARRQPLAYPAALPSVVASTLRVWPAITGAG